jgi:hypothetical protein
MTTALALSAHLILRAVASRGAARADHAAKREELFVAFHKAFGLASETDSPAAHPRRIVFQNRKTFLDPSRRHGLL